MPSFHEHVVSSPRRLAREICSDVMATEDEIAHAIAFAVRYEREQCALIADRLAEDARPKHRAEAGRELARLIRGRTRV